jgi:cell pole-organizing protein PopZ
MEDILASIRRILSEDEVAASGTAAPEPQAAPPGDHADRNGVLVLDPSMMVSHPPASPGTAPEPEPVATTPASTAPVPQTLIAPEAAAAAAASVGSLVRTLSAERGLLVRAGGPSIEDIIREELRPLLKAWLDANLPPIVERLVRAEIERVVGRAVP